MASRSGQRRFTTSSDSTTTPASVLRSVAENPRPWTMTIPMTDMKFEEMNRYGTGAVMVALRDAGLAPDHDALTRARAWLEAHQNDDGGWGEDVRSYDDPAWRGRGSSTPSQTAWALMGLLAIGAPGAPTTRTIERGIAHLVDTQRADGGWDESLLYP